MYFIEMTGVGFMLAQRTVKIFPSWRITTVHARWINCGNDKEYSLSQCDKRNYRAWILFFETWLTKISEGFFSMWISVLCFIEIPIGPVWIALKVTLPRSHPVSTAGKRRWHMHDWLKIATYKHSEKAKRLLFSQDFKITFYVTFFLGKQSQIQRTGTKP